MYRETAGVAFPGWNAQYTGRTKESALTKIGITYLSVALVSAVIAVAAPWWPLRIALIWLAVSLALMAAAYLGAGPRLLFKRRRGTLYPASWLLMGPFRLCNALAFNVYHRLLPEPAWAEVVPGLILGRRLWAKEARALGPVRVLDLTGEMSETRCLREQAGYVCLPVLDNGCPTPDQLRAGVAWLQENHPRGRVYVHCAAGHGRSATVVIAYLLTIGLVASVEEGVALLQSKRPRVYLNRDQRLGLKPFAACHLQGNAHNTGQRPEP